MAKNPFAQMSVMIESQTAAAEAMREAAVAIRNAANMQSDWMGKNIVTEGPQPGDPGYPSNNGSSADNRPRMPGNQTFRPVHGDTKSAGGRGLSGIRSRIAQQLNNRIGADSGPTFDRIIGPNGEDQGYKQINRDGTFQLHHRDADGNVAEGVEKAVSAAGKRATISRGIGALSEGGLMSGAKAVPYLGGAVMAGEAVFQGAQFVADQRRQNADWQSIYGGSNLGTGLSNRAQSAGFGLSQMFSGGLGWGQSQEAFRGVSSLGFQGAQRSQDLSFISSNYKSMGMGVAQSLELISTASKNLNTNLAGLKTSLQDVSNEAKKTGQNAGVARQNYSNTYAQVGGFNPGAGSSTVAGILAQQQTGAGRTMGKYSMAPLYSSTTGVVRLAAAASQGGNPTSPTQMMNDIAKGDRKALAAGDEVLKQVTAQWLSQPGVMDAINKISKEMGGSNGVAADPDTFGRRASDALSNILNSMAVAASISTIPGYENITPTDALILVAQVGVGLAGNNAGKYDQKQKENQQDLSKIKTSGSGAYGANSTGATTGYTSKVDSSGVSRVIDQISNIKGVNPVVDHAKEQLKGKHLIVETAKGRRVVTVDEAAKDYTDQVAKGTAVVAETGETVSDALGGEKETNYVGADTTKSTPSAASKKGSAANKIYGQDVDAFNKDLAKKNDKKVGNLTITASPILMKYLSFIDADQSGQNMVNNAAANNTTPQPGTR